MDLQVGNSQYSDFFVEVELQIPKGQVVGDQTYSFGISETQSTATQPLAVFDEIKLLRGATHISLPGRTRNRWVHTQYGTRDKLWKGQRIFLPDLGI